MAITPSPQSKKQSPRQLFVQLALNFVLPILVLTRFSTPSTLGPTNALLLALAFPVIYELYNIYRTKKLSWLSVIAIGGIAVTGGLGLLHVSPGWLAARRSIPYVFMSLVILISQRINRPLAEIALKRVFDMNIVQVCAKKKGTAKKLTKSLTNISYYTSFLFGLIGLTSYLLSRLVVVSPAGAPAFNQEYARLRLLSLPFITLPLLLGFIAIIWYLLHKIEKLTGLDSDDYTRS